VKVRIDAGGREVEIECPADNVSPKEIADKVLEVWKETAGAQDSGGPAFGFSQDRRWSAEKTPLANGSYTRNMPVREVDA
jgi:hypothetical protein